MKPIKFFVDISPLGDSAWTGIPKVTANMARYFVDTWPEGVVFYNGADTILPQFVRVAVESAPGGYLHDFIRSRNAIASPLRDAMHGDFISVGIFPNKKPVHRIFNFEIAILHDLSTILLPEMHDPEVASEYSRAHMRDVATSDLVCCVSEATRQDAIIYLKAPPERMFVSHLGCEAAPCDVDAPEISEPVPPYVIVLGTVEPRKNLSLIAEFLRCRPEICNQVAFLFVGRRGWGRRFEDTFESVLQIPQCRDRIGFTDYVSEKTKQRLIRHAAFAIYPSVFEGFGLPVIECMAAGCPVITSRSSSLLELGLDGCFYFDPLSLTDFSRAFDLVLEMSCQREIRQRLSLELMDRASAFTWDAFGKRIVDRVTDHVANALGTDLDALSPGQRS